MIVIIDNNYHSNNGKYVWRFIDDSYDSYDIR